MCKPLKAAIFVRVSKTYSQKIPTYVERMKSLQMNSMDSMTSLLEGIDTGMTKPRIMSLLLERTH